MTVLMYVGSRDVFMTVVLNSLPFICTFISELCMCL